MTTNATQRANVIVLAMTGVLKAEHIAQVVGLSRAQVYRIIRRNPDVYEHFENSTGEVFGPHNTPDPEPPR